MKVLFFFFLQPKVVTDLDEEDIKKRMELMELEDDMNSEIDDEEEGNRGGINDDGDDDGLVAPKGLDQQADMQEVSHTTNQTAEDSD